MKSVRKIGLMTDISLMMKPFKYLLWMVILFGCIACHQKPDAVDSQNRPIQLADYQHKWLVVNYWATWCKPCLTELPELNALNAQYAKQLSVLGVSFDGLANAEIESFSQSFHITFPLLSTFPIQRFGIKEIVSLPVSFIFDPLGHLSKTLYGPQTEKSILQALNISQHVSR